MAQWQNLVGGVGGGGRELENGGQMFLRWRNSSGGAGYKRREPLFIMP